MCRSWVTNHSVNSIFTPRDEEYTFGCTPRNQNDAYCSEVMRCALRARELYWRELEDPLYSGTIVSSMGSTKSSGNQTVQQIYLAVAEMVETP